MACSSKAVVKITAEVFDQLQHFKSVDLRHLYVQKNKIGFVLGNGLHTLEAVVAFCNDLHVGMGLEVFFNNTPREGSSSIKIALIMLSVEFLMSS